MAYPTGMLSLVLEQIDEAMISMKQQAQAARAAMAAGSVSSSTILGTYIALRQYRVSLALKAATPGLAQYARDQKNDQGLDVVAEFTTVLATIDAVADWVSTTFPKDANGFLLAQTLGADGPVDRQFTPAQTEGMRTQLDSLIATIG